MTFHLPPTTINAKVINSATAKLLFYGLILINLYRFAFEHYITHMTG